MVDIQLDERDRLLTNPRIFDTNLTSVAIKKLLRFKITRMSGLLQIEEDDVIKMAYHNHLRKKEIQQIKEYRHTYFSDRLSIYFVFLLEKKIK